MILVIHGNDTVSSRNYYFEEKNKGSNPVLLNGEGLLYDQLFQTAENKSFFDESNFILIENFFSKNKSNTIEFKKIINYLISNKNLNIIFWENSEVSKNVLLQLKNATVKQFSFPQILFTFLDNIKPGYESASIKLFHDLEKSMEPELIFFMLIRQFRLLISQIENGNNKIDEVKRMAPWQVSKLKNQLRFFDKKRLIDLYDKLLEIEIGQKTGRFPYPMEKSIDFFLLDL